MRSFCYKKTFLACKFLASRTVTSRIVVVSYFICLDKKWRKSGSFTSNYIQYMFLSLSFSSPFLALSLCSLAIFFFSEIVDGCTDRMTNCPAY